MPKSAHFRIESLSEAYRRVTFDHPPLNLLDSADIADLCELIDEMIDDTALKVVVFDSADTDFFIAHYDVGRAAVAKVATAGLPPWIYFTTRLANADVVSIASVRGRTRGVGSEFVLACDMCFASQQKAVFCQPEVGVGLIPGGGAIERLPQFVGRARALEIVLGSDDFDAATAERYGWINRALPDQELDAFVDNLARRIASFDRQALSKAKRLINRRGLVDLGDLLASREAYTTSLASQGSAERRAKIAKLGLGQRGDFELRLGHHLGRLAEAAPLPKSA
jgi:enoyl-CoA hydratase/carnithine racemase